MPAQRSAAYPSRQQRKLDCEYRPLIGTAALSGDLPAVQLNNMVDDREPEAEPAMTPHRPAGTLPEDSAVSAKPATDQASGGVRGMAKCADKVYECTPGVLFACKVAEAGKPKEVWCAEAKR